MLVLAGACRRDLPLPTPDEARILAAARAVAPDPSVGCRSGASLQGLDGEPRTITIGDEERGYLIDAPAIAADRPLPVVLSFHGFRSGARQQRW